MVFGRFLGVLGGGARFWGWGELSEEGLGQVRCRVLVFRAR